MKQVIVFGSLNMDLTIQCERMPMAGETVEGSNFLANPGGKGGNQAVASAKSGAVTRMIACVGKDVFGRELLECLEKYQVDCSETGISEDGQTGVAMITCHDGDNRIILNPGTNFELTSADVKASLERISSPGDYFVTQYECDKDTVLESLRIAKQRGMYTIFNPAPAKSIPRECYSDIDLLVLNQTETQFQTGIFPKEIATCKDAISALLKMGAGQVIITLGSNGSIFNMGDELKIVPACKTEVVDTTAAGDTYIGALAARLAAGKSLEESVQYATKAAALTITRYGAQQAIPCRDEVEAFRTGALV